MITYESCIQAMTNRPDLFEGVDEGVMWRFHQWLPNNTHVISAFGRYARELKDHGNRTHYSAKAICERLRWDSMVKENGSDYKLSNDMTTPIARLLMAVDPKLEGMFRFKTRESLK